MNVVAAHLSLPKEGEVENGDRALVRSDSSGRTLLAVIDGLGHGPGASKVSQTAVDYLLGIELDIAAHVLMERLHGQLSGSRGAAATLCSTATSGLLSLKP